MGLFEDSGQTPERRDQEASQLVERLAAAYARDDGLFERLDPRSANFLGQMFTRRSQNRLTGINPKQLFWLRDLIEKTGG